MNADGGRIIFELRRAKAIEALRRDGTLAATWRVLGMEIFACMTDEAAGLTDQIPVIAGRAKIGIKNANVAIRKLKDAGYLAVRRRGRYGCQFLPTWERRA